MAGRDQEDALEDAGRVELEDQAALDQTLHDHGGGGVRERVGVPRQLLEAHDRHAVLLLGDVDRAVVDDADRRAVPDAGRA